MSTRSAKRVKRALKERVEDFDRFTAKMTPAQRAAYKRPGSLNRKRSRGGSGGKRRKK